LKFALLIPAAGNGARLGADLPKTLIGLAGRPIFVHAADLLVRHPECVEAVIAAPAGYEADYTRIAVQTWPHRKVGVITGGATRQESVSLALKGVTQSCQAIVVHDAARVFLSDDLIHRTLSAVNGNFVASLPGLPVTDTIKRVTGHPLIVSETVDREGLVAVQTPQVILRDVMIRAHRLAADSKYEGTDDVSLVERFDLGPIRVVAGDPRNFKITTPEDLIRARELLEDASR
jgi:2-C-methyl-D-erythritol 4-phosphate cytidylyltransferase